MKETIFPELGTGLKEILTEMFVIGRKSQENKAGSLSGVML